jgi:hypothetical protein
VAVVPGMDVGIAPSAVDDVGMDGTAMEGGGRGATPGGGGKPSVEPGRKVMNDVPGCVNSVRYGVPVLVEVEEVTGTADVVGAADIDGGVAVVAAIDDVEVTGTVGVPGAICPVGVEQVTTVPGVVGSEASGTGASVVSAAPGCVVEENGLGPLSGDVTIAPGVDGRPMAVVPRVETCARLVLQPNSRATVVDSRRCIAIPSSETL